MSYYSHTTGAHSSPQKVIFCMSNITTERSSPLFCAWYQSDTVCSVWFTAGVVARSSAKMCHIRWIPLIKTFAYMFWFSCLSKASNSLSAVLIIECTFHTPQTKIPQRLGGKCQPSSFLLSRISFIQENTDVLQTDSSFWHRSGCACACVRVNTHSFSVSGWLPPLASPFQV